MCGAKPRRSGNGALVIVLVVVGWMQGGKLVFGKMAVLPNRFQHFPGQAVFWKECFGVGVLG